MTALESSLARSFRSDAGLLVHMLDAPQDRLLLARMSEADYREASFLDQRLLAAERPSQWVEWGALESIAPDLSDRAVFLFHIGHVGSTLISRLLGELDAVLALREPMLLRALAELERMRGRPQSPWSPEELDRRLDAALGWLSRTFAVGQRPMVKMTSFANVLAEPIQRRGRRSACLFASAQTYVETIIAGPASRVELAALAGERLARLHDLLGEAPWRLWSMSPGERAAMSWACEMLALGEAEAAAAPGDLVWLDFDAFLAAPEPRLAALADHFGLTLGSGAAARLTEGPIMRRYSKAPEHEYSPALRNAVLAQARDEHREELAAAMRWIDAAAVRFAPIAAAMARKTGA